MTAIEWIAFFVLLVSALAASVAVILSNTLVTREIRLLKEAYRQQKSLQAEREQAQVVQQRRAELALALSRPDGLRDVLAQVLADAFPDQAIAGQADDWITVVDVTATPPAFTAARQDESGTRYQFTVAPDGHKREAIPLDATLAPTARVEVQAVWEHVAQQRSLDPHMLPRQSQWYLIVQQAGK